jgi:hypothetical protein
VIAYDCPNAERLKSEPIAPKASNRSLSFIKIGAE